MHRRTIPTALLSVATALILIGPTPAHAGETTLHRAELFRGELALCVESADGRFETLRVDPRSGSIYATESGCGELGAGERLDVTREPGRPRTVAQVRNTAFYDDGSGRRALAIPLTTPATAVSGCSAGTCGSAPAGHRGKVHHAVQRTYHPRRLSQYGDSYRVRVPGPRAADIGDIAAGETLSALEHTLDPVLEPAIAVTARGASGAVGVATGVALYPFTLLEVLVDELGPVER